MAAEKEGSERRRHPRHPIHVAIEYHEMESPDSKDAIAIDLSQAGIGFFSDKKFTKDSNLNFTIRVGYQLFEIEGKVAYCFSHGDRYRVGVEFTKPSGVFQAKFIEQMGKLKEYQQKLSQELGREISEEEAARRWLDKYAGPAH